MNMHHFNVDMAIKHGLVIAIILQYMNDCQGMNGGEPLSFSYDELCKKFSYIPKGELKSAITYIFHKSLGPVQVVVR